MKFIEAELPGAFLIECEPYLDERGMFARYFCQREFEAHGLKAEIVQCNFSQNKKKGTIRGMHFQHPPFAEVKIVRCLKGRIYDVIIDIRPDSPAFLKWQAFELSAQEKNMVYIPEGFAHGYQSLTAGCEVLYMVTQFYAPDHERGIRWNDPMIGIKWPLVYAPIVSPKDATHPDYQDVRSNRKRS